MKKNIVKILYISLMLFIWIIGLWGGKTDAYAQAVEGNVYAMVVSTGVSGGDNIGIFEINYKDVGGNTYQEYIYPHDGDYQKSCEYIDRYTEDGGLIGGRKIKALEPFSDNVFVFDLPVEIEEIESIAIYTDNNVATTKTWTCQGLRFYKVSDIEGFCSYVAGDGDFYADFAGTMIAKLAKSGVDFASASETKFVIAPDKSQYKLQMDEFGDESERMLAGECGYNILFELADIYGGGIEAFSNYEKKALRDLNLPDVLVLNVSYIDKYDIRRSFDLPLISSTIEQIGEEFGEDVCLSHLAGQGDTLSSYVRMPNMKQVESIRVVYDDGVVEDTTNPRLKTLQENADSISVVGIRLYKNEKDKQSIKMRLCNGTVFEPYTESNVVPEFFYTSSSTVGVLIGWGRSSTFEIKPYDAASSLKAQNTQQRYLIVLDTHEVSTADSRKRCPEIELRLSYLSGGNREKSTEILTLRDLSKDYYGYYFDTAGNECAYEMSVGQGRRLCAILSQSDVETFTGATFGMIDSNAEWQVKNFGIYLIQDMSVRRAVWMDNSISYFGKTANVEYYRDINGKRNISPEDALFYAQLDMLLQGENTKSIEFSSHSVSEVLGVFDWMENYSESMSYSVAASNLGFYRARTQYEIDVKVANNANNSIEDGDSGSKNGFFFQLIFKEGKKSGFVQANQQLESDGFLTGQTSKFNISVNQNFGDLEAIRIIPDDISENATPYDKLNIEKITVTKRQNNGLGTVWQIDNVGWVGIDYKDEGEETLAEDKSRPIEEVANTYYVTGEERNVMLEFAITTGNYGDGSGNLTEQFQGSVYADITYIDMDGQYKTVTVSDVVENMYSYANKTANQNAGNAKRLSDKNFMFRENMTNRFRCSLSDISRLESMTLYVYSDREAVLNISSLAASLVSQDGFVTINKWGEYERKGKTLPITSNAEVIPTFVVGAGVGATSYTVNFIETDDEMIEGLAEGTWSYTVPVDPLSQYDYLNVFLYPVDENTREAADGMTAQVTYADAYGDNFVVKDEFSFVEATQSTIVDEDGGVGTFQTEKTVAHYSITKLGAKNMEAVKSLGIHWENESGSLPLSYAIVQRVRGGKIISSERFEFEGRDATDFPVISMKTPIVSDLEKQVVTLSFDESMWDVLLTDGRDVAVALHYTSDNDPTGAEYISSYGYLTKQNVNMISGGDFVEVEFNESNVDEISAVTVAAVGGTSLVIDKVAVGTYETVMIPSFQTLGTVDAKSSEEDPQQSYSLLNEWYSFSSGTTVTNDSVRMNVVTKHLSANETVVPITMNIKTAISDGMDTGCNSPIRMVVNYRGFNGLPFSKVYNDIKKYTVSGGSYESGGEATVRLYELGAKEIVSIAFEPYDEEADYIQSWKLQGIDISYGVGMNKKSLSMEIGEFLYEGAPTYVGVQKTIVDLTAILGETKQNVKNGKMLVNMNATDTLKFTYNVHNSTAGAHTYVYEIKDGNRYELTGCIVETEDDLGNTIYSFVTPVAAAGTKATYEIEVVSSENPAAKAVIVVSVTTQTGQGNTNQQDEDDTSVSQNTTEIEIVN